MSLSQPGDDPHTASEHLLERALRLSAGAHAGQSRKGTSLPYVIHPAAVALILARAGFGEDDVLAAALLHDVVEDTDVTLDDLAREFPEPVCEYVAAASEQKLDADGRKRPWRDRKEDHIRQVADAPLAARAVVLADKLHNLQSMLFDLDGDGVNWERFHAPPEQIMDYHRRMIAAAAGDDEALRPLARQAMSVLGRIESSLQEN